MDFLRDGRRRSIDAAELVPTQVEDGHHRVDREVRREEDAVDAAVKAAKAKAGRWSEAARGPSMY